MKCFWLWLAALCPTLLFAAPKYHAVDLGYLPTGIGGSVYSMATDGSMALTAGTPSGYLRRSDGTFTSFAELTGGLKARQVQLTSADTFSFNDWGSVSVFGGERREIYGDIPGDYYGTKVSKTTLDGDYCYTVYNTTSEFSHKAKGYYQRNGQWQLINNFLGYLATRVEAVNRFGDVVGGVSYTAEIPFRAFLIPRGSTVPVLLPLGMAYDINDLSSVIGHSGSTMEIFQHGSTRSITSPQGAIEYDYRVKLNNRDQVVWHDFHNGIRDPFLWENGQSWWLRDLLDNRSILPETASFQDLGFNDHGQIAGSFFENGKTRLFRFDPVPEPATYLALGLGLAAILRRRR